MVYGSVAAIRPGLSAALVATALLFWGEIGGLVHGQGALQPPPGPPEATQKSLEEIWDRLGTIGEKASTLESSLEASQAGIAALTDSQAAIDSDLAALESDAGQQQLLLAVAFQERLPWRLTDTNSGAPSASEHDLALGPDGIPAVAYPDVVSGGLRFATFDGATWTSELIDTSIGTRWPSLAYDSDGNPAIAYFDVFVDALRFAQFDGKDWNIATVAAGAEPGNRRPCSLAFGPDGLPAIAYYDDANGDLVFANFTGTIWGLKALEHTADTSGVTDAAPSLTYGPDGNPAISFYDSIEGDLRLTRFDGSSWNVETVDSGGDTGVFSSLAFAPDGLPAIAFKRPFGVVSYAKFADDTWVFTQIDPTGNSGAYLRLAFGPDGKPNIGYQAEAFESIRLARFDGRDWILTRLNNVFVDGTSSMVVGPDGLPVVSFIDRSQRVVRLVRRYLPAP